MAVYARYHYGDDVATRDPALLSKFCKRRVSMFTTLSHHRKLGNLTEDEYSTLRHYAHIADLDELETFPLNAYRKGLIVLDDLPNYVSEKDEFPADIKKQKGFDLDKYQEMLIDIVTQHRLCAASNDSLAQDFNYCIKFLQKRSKLYSKDDKKTGSSSSASASPEISEEEDVAPRMSQISFEDFKKGIQISKK